MDPYAMLGVSRNATQEQIKDAYRALAKKHHPDLNPGSKRAEGRFKEVRAAYEAIGTPESRSRYDRGQREGAEGSGQRGPFYRETQGGGFGPGGRAGRYAFSGGIDEDLFESLFGGARSQPSPDPRFRRQGDDLVLDLRIPLTLAVFGGQVRVPTIDGEVILRVPPRSNIGTRLRLAGKGVANRAGKRGDQLVVLQILLPRAIDAELEEALRQWQRRHPEEAVGKEAA